MSRDLLLQYAKGNKIKRKYFCTFEVDRETKEIIIHSCSINSHPLPPDSLFLQCVQTKEDFEIDVPDEELYKAIELFMNDKKTLKTKD